MTPSIRHMALILTLPFLLGNQACDRTVASLGVDTYLDDACGSSALSPYVGAALSSVPASLRTGLDERVINPGDMMTQDYRASRLNISLDAAGGIMDVYCG